MRPCLALALAAAALLAAPVPASAQTQARTTCTGCHADREFLAGKGGTPQGDAALFVPDSLLHDSQHDTLRCASCHENFDAAYPHQPQARTVTCGSCHEAVQADFAASSHSAEEASGDAPVCATCHGVHQVLSSDDPRSPTFPLAEASLCGECHEDPAILETYFADPADSVARAAATQYHETVHGLAIEQGGLIVSATCSDCHTAHLVLPSDSTRSSVARDNIPATCGTCHTGVQNSYATSAHGRALDDPPADAEHTAPVCNTCHSAHGVVPPDESWRTAVVDECGECHEALYETYFDTYHGKVTRLGSEITARCSDCHTPHDNLPPDDPASSVHPANLVETCGACHEESSARFVQYFAHGNHSNREAYPQMYWTWLLMTSLLVGVFAFFGLHTALWLYRSVVGTPARFAAHAPGAADREPAAPSVEEPPSEKVEETSPDTDPGDRP